MFRREVNDAAEHRVRGLELEALLVHRRRRELAAITVLWIAPGLSTR
jgi:hypothetical protein